MRAGYDPDNLPPRESRVNVESEIKTWRDIWAAGQGVGAVCAVETTNAIVTRWEREFDAARRNIVDVERSS